MEIYFIIYVFKNYFLNKSVNYLHNKGNKIFT